MTDPHVDQLRARAASRKPRQLTRLLIRALAVARAVNPRETYVLCAASAVSALVSVGQVLAAKKLALSLLGVNSGSRSAHDLLVPLLAVAALTALASLITASTSQRQQLLGEQISLDSWQKLFAVSSRVRLAAFDDPAFYDRMQRVETYTLTQPLSVVQGFLGLITGALGVAGIVVTLLVIAPLLVPLVVVSAIPILFLQRRGSRIEYEFAIAQTPGLRARYSIGELLTGRSPAKEVRAFGSAEHLTERFSSSNRDYIDALRIKLRRRFVLTVVSSVVVVAITVAEAAIIVLLLDDHRLSVAGATAAATAAALLAGRVQILATGVGGLYQAALFLEDLDAFLTGREHPLEELGTADSALEAFDELRCEGVTYTYPGAATPALQGVDLVVKRGEIVALVGENGSGKTTLSKLLAHLYEPQTGTISWDGVDVSSIPLADRRRLTTVLFQDFVHYEMSAYDNVALGDVDRRTDTEAVHAVAVRAGVDGIVEALPQGWETLLSQRFPGGRDLSGGQWQRLSLARALFRGAPFVLLDEPTAALDPRAEAEFFETLRATLLAETVVFVSHRFSSVAHADRIVVMDRGRVSESGTHRELMQLGGHYSKLYALQAAAYETQS